MKKFLKNILDEYNEFLIMPIVFVALILSPVFLRWFDPTAGAFDIGILQSVLVMAFGSAAVFSLSWIEYKLSWPLLAKWADDVLERRLNEYSKSEGYSPFHFNKAILALTVYFIYATINTIILVALL